MKTMRDYRKKISVCLNNLIEHLFPYICAFCRHPSDRRQDLCHACLADLAVIPTPCPRCAKPLPFNFICGDCLKTSPPYDRTFVLFAYTSPITRFIMQLKFNHALMNARILGELLAYNIQHHWYQQTPLPEVIIPLPLHKQRLKERGFNQAIEIARPISKLLQIPIDKTSFLRIKQTAAQATLPARDRVQNVKNAFYAKKPVNYRHVAVIDDVITTGNTMTEFCKTLKKTGIETIDVWCCARPLL